jgi:hypothetical protein
MDDRPTVPKDALGIHLSPLINNHYNDMKSIYPPSKPQLNIDFSTSYNYQPRTHYSYIERRFSNKDQQNSEQVCKY